jgi:hypothetical protein
LADEKLGNKMARSSLSFGVIPEKQIFVKKSKAGSSIPPARGTCEWKRG